MTTISRDPGGLGFDAAEPTDPHQLGHHRHLLVSERLRLRRRQLGLTQNEVVARLHRLGVDTTNKALSSLEHGAGLDVRKLPELARALECTLTYLMGLSSDPLRWEPDGRLWPSPTSGAADHTPAQPTVSTRPGTATADWSVARPEGSQGPWILGPLFGPRRR